MAIKSFAFLILVISLGSYFIPIESIKKNALDKDVPLVIFESPFMYTIDENSINRIVQATHAIKYENRDEMYDANILLKNLDKTQDFKNEKLKADLIVKKGNDYILTDNVKYNRDDFMKLDTQELFYNDINKIVKNNKPYNATYYSHLLNGENIYLDINKDLITSKNTHFEIKIDKKEKGKK